MVRDKDEIMLCWKALENKMEKLDFSENEKELLKNKLLKEEAMQLRK